MNNSIKNGYGEIVGFRCWTCGDVFQSMWGETCNRCRKQEEQANKMQAEIRRLTNALKDLNNSHKQ
jgi:DNA-directed RNA polymerase subunit N (RpoN/RPB10)